MKSFLVLLNLLVGTGEMTQVDRMFFASETCLTLRETSKSNPNHRTRILGEARETLDGKPYSRGEEEIERAIKYGTCELLVLESEDYEITTIQRIALRKEHEKARALQKEKEQQLERENTQDTANN
jgi:hypothetical protein